MGKSKFNGQAVVWRVIALTLTLAFGLVESVSFAGQTKPAKSVKSNGKAKNDARVIAKVNTKKGSPKVGAKLQNVRLTKAEKNTLNVMVRGKNGRVNRVMYIPPAPAKLSFGAMAGLHSVGDPLELRSSVALVMDQDTREVLLRKNDSAVLPIASLTKLMSGLVISEAHLSLDDPITITEADVDTEKGSRSRLFVGATLLRGELLHLALMSSENRAAHALGRTYPGGLSTFVAHMNARAQSLGMRDTRYVEPTGLSSANQSTAQDLALLVAATSRDRLLRDLSTSPGYTALVGDRLMQFNTTNALVKNPEWEIGVQKTGYISEAGQCLVMQAKIAGRKLIMVFLDSTGKLSRVADAQRVKRWVEANSLASSQLQSKVDVPSAQPSAI